jgi:hypothetical protein
LERDNPYSMRDQNLLPAAMLAFVDETFHDQWAVPPLGQLFDSVLQRREVVFQSLRTELCLGAGAGAPINSRYALMLTFNSFG